MAAEEGDAESSEHDEVCNVACLCWQPVCLYARD